MKSINLSLVALLGLLCACSGGLENDDAQPGELRAVSVTQVSVVGESPVSRAIIDNDTYQLGVIREAAPPYAAVWNHPFSYTASGWTSSVPIAVDHRPATFHAYYPYHTAVGDYSRLAGNTNGGAYYGDQFFLTAQAYSAAEDICISKTGVTVAADGDAAPTLSFLDMPHVYSRIQLTLTRGAADATTGAYKITNINFYRGKTEGGQPLFSSRALQYVLNKKEVYPEQIVGGWNYNPKVNSILPGATAATIDLLVPPQPIDVSLGLGLKFTIDIDDRLRLVTIPAGQFTDNKLAAGVQYQIALTLTDEVITMDGTVKTEEWVEPSYPIVPGGGVQIPKEPTERVPWIAIPSTGLKVAKGNLMRGDGNIFWYLAPDQGCYTYASQGDDYFCWGDPNSHSIDNGGYQNTNEITAGCVAVLGPGWRVPTRGDFYKLIQQSIWGTYNSQRGKSNGRYFGTTTVPSASIQDEYVFLPAAGGRSNDGSMNLGGSHGFYWSSEPYGSDYAYYLYFNSGYVGGANDNVDRVSGHSVRCVANL